MKSCSFSKWLPCRINNSRNSEQVDLSLRLLTLKSNRQRLCSVRVSRSCRRSWTKSMTRLLKRSKSTRSTWEWTCNKTVISFTSRKRVSRRRCQISGSLAGLQEETSTISTLIQSSCRKITPVMTITNGIITRQSHRCAAKRRRRWSRSKSRSSRNRWCNSNNRLSLKQSVVQELTIAQFNRWC